MTKRSSIPRTDAGPLAYETAVDSTPPDPHKTEQAYYPREAVSIRRTQTKKQLGEIAPDADLNAPGAARIYGSSPFDS